MGRYDMFVSYRRDNMGAAEYVYNQLTGQGYQVFLDVQALTAGRFMDEIRRGMEESELVLALLTEQSVQRMAKGPGDPVWQELDTVRQQNIPITFLWLSAGETEFQQVMAAHRDGDLLDWIAGHSVTPVDDLGPSLERAVTQIIQVLEDVRKRRLEAYRQSDTPEQEERFTGDDVPESIELTERDVTYRYTGEMRLAGSGEYRPYGRGLLEELSASEERRIFDGQWDEAYLSGRGTVYLRRDGQDRAVYQGHWNELLYHDVDGILYDKQGQKVYRGGMLNGRKALNCWERMPNGAIFTGIRHETYAISGTIRYPNGDIYTGEVRNDSDENGENTLIPCGFGQMLRANGDRFQGRFTISTAKPSYPWGEGAFIRPAGEGEVSLFSVFNGWATKSDCPIRIQVRPHGAREFRTVFDGTLERGENFKGTRTYDCGGIFTGAWRGAMQDGVLELDGTAVSLKKGIPTGRPLDSALLETLLERLDEDHRLMEWIHSMIGMSPWRWQEITAQALDCLRNAFNCPEPPAQQEEAPLIVQLARYVALPPSGRFRLSVPEHKLMGEIISDQWGYSPKVRLNLEELEGMARKGIVLESYYQEAVQLYHRRIARQQEEAQSLPAQQQKTALPLELQMAYALIEDAAQANAPLILPQGLTLRTTMQEGDQFLVEGLYWRTGTSIFQAVLGAGPDGRIHVKGCYDRQTRCSVEGFTGNFHRDRRAENLALKG